MWLRGGGRQKYGIFRRKAGFIGDFCWKLSGHTDWDQPRGIITLNSSRSPVLPKVEIYPHCGDIQGYVGREFWRFYLVKIPTFCEKTLKIPTYFHMWGFSTGTLSQHCRSPQFFPWIFLEATSRSLEKIFEKNSLKRNMAASTDTSLLITDRSEGKW